MQSTPIKPRVAPLKLAIERLPAGVNAIRRCFLNPHDGNLPFHSSGRGFDTDNTLIEALDSKPFYPEKPVRNEGSLPLARQALFS